MNRAERQTRARAFTCGGVEIPSVTAAQMREVDRLAVEETGPNLLSMMESAGRDLALLAIGLLGGDWERRRVVVLAGAGGNGGGGMSCARRLSNWGVHAKLCVTQPPPPGTATAFQLGLFRSARGREEKAEAVQGEPADLIVDAMIGYGLNAAPREPVAGLIEWANGSGVPILSLDVPSGVDATTGETPGSYIQPTWTMTLALPKAGLATARTGELFLADIGIPARIYRRLGLEYTSPFGNRLWARLDNKTRRKEEE